MDPVPSNCKIRGLTFVTIILSLLILVEAKGTMDDLQRLNDTLFKDYTCEFRPVYNLTDTLYVNYSYYLYSIIDFNEVSEMITLSGNSVFNWYDFRLTWNPDDYGVYGMVVKADTIWTPKLVLHTGMDSLQQAGSHVYDAYVASTGLIYWNPGGILKSACKADMTRFPHDVHNCTLVFSDMIHTKYEITFVSSYPTVQTQYWSSSGEWDLLHTVVTDRFTKYENVSSASYIAMVINFKRKSAYFIVNIILPVAILCLIEPFVFLIPHDASDRISFALTLFLSLAVYMTMIGDSMPTTSEPMARISYFMLATVVHSTMDIILVIVTVRLKHSQKGTPTWLNQVYRRMSIKTLAKRKKTRTKEAQEVNENCPLESDVKNERHKEEIKRLDVVRKVLNMLDRILFVFSFSTMLVMFLLFYLVYM